MGSLPAEIRVESVRCAGSWERERQGRGNEFPRPASRHPPVAISPRSSTWGDPGEEPGTAAPPDITTHGPCPGRGRGRSAEGAGGVGGPARYPGIPCRRRDRGGGGRQKCMGIFLQRRGRGGGAGEVSGYPLPKARPGRGCRRGIRVSPCRRRGWDVGEERIGIPPSGIPAENVAPGGNVSASRAPLCSRHLFLPVSRHNLPGIEDRSV